MLFRKIICAHARIFALRLKRKSGKGKRKKEKGKRKKEDKNIGEL